MVIEHIFVTTYSATETLVRASEYLAPRGFIHNKQAAFPVEGEEWSVLEMNRGKKKAARARNVMQLPQTVRIEWDRGRVTTALSIAANQAWGGSSFSFTLSGVAFAEDVGSVTGSPKKMKLHQNLLQAIAVGLENALAHDAAGTMDYTGWDAVEAEILKAARKRKIRNFIIFFSFLAVVIGLVVLLISTVK